MTAASDRSPRRVVIVVGLGHSGSTLLDLMLSGHPAIVGVGEAQKMTAPAKRIERLADEAKRCTCGEAIPGCRLWGRYRDAIAASPDADRDTAYGFLLDALRAAEPQTAWLSDSSKNEDALRELAAMHAAGVIDDLRVLHLVRDVRSLAASQLGRANVAGRLRRWRTLAASFRLWRSQSERHLREIAALGLPSLPVGYEELCFFPEATMQSVAAFLDLPFDPAMLAPSPAGGHVTTGNPMRLDAGKSTRLAYDHRWFFNPTISRLYGLWPGVRRLNERLVYSRSKPDPAAATFRPPAIEREPASASPTSNASPISA